MFSQLKEANSQLGHFSTSVLFYRCQSLPLPPSLSRQTVSESRVLIWIWVFEAGWAFGQPSVTRWWVGVSDQSGLIWTLGRRVCLTAGAPTLLCMLLQSRRDDYLGITRVVKRLDNVWISKMTLICERVVRSSERVCTTDLWFLEGILMSALSRQTCFHFPNWDALL